MLENRYSLMSEIIVQHVRVGILWSSLTFCQVKILVGKYQREGWSPPWCGGIIYDVHYSINKKYSMKKHVIKLRCYAMSGLVSARNKHPKHKSILAVLKWVFFNILIQFISQRKLVLKRTLGHLIRLLYATLSVSTLYFLPNTPVK